MKSFRCKYCKTKTPIDTEIITSWIHRFCSKSCRRSFNAEQNKKTKEKEKQKKKNKRETTSMLTKKLDKIFSEYIRRKYSNSEWMITCISCEKVIHWKESHNCHWISRWNKQYRFDEENCRPWCAWCNTFNQAFHIRIFTTKQISRLGQETVDLMIDNTNYVYKLGKTELKALIEEFNTKLNNL